MKYLQLVSKRKQLQTPSFSIGTNCKEMTVSINTKNRVSGQKEASNAEQSSKAIERTRCTKSVKSERRKKAQARAREWFHQLELKKEKSKVVKRCRYVSVSASIHNPSPNLTDHETDGIEVLVSTSNPTQLSQEFEINDGKKDVFNEWQLHSFKPFTGSLRIELEILFSQLIKCMAMLAHFFCIKLFEGLVLLLHYLSIIFQKISPLIANLFEQTRTSMFAEPSNVQQK